MKGGTIKQFYDIENQLLLYLEKSYARHGGLRNTKHLSAKPA